MYYTLTGDLVSVLNLFLSVHHYGNRLSEQHTGDGHARGDFVSVLNLFLSVHHYGNRLSAGDGHARDQSHALLN